MVFVSLPSYGNLSNNIECLKIPPHLWCTPFAKGGLLQTESPLVKETVSEASRGILGFESLPDYFGLFSRNWPYKIPPHLWCTPFAKGGLLQTESPLVKETVSEASRGILGNYTKPFATSTSAFNTPPPAAPRTRL